jgi:branched-chain amino acid transport system permease protein
MEFWINQTFNGLSYAALLFLLGGGFTLIFGIMKIVNIAHGSFYLVGGYIGLTVVSLTGSFYFALFASALAMALMGLVMERVFLRTLAGQDLRQMLVTTGIALFLQDLSLLVWGGDPKNLTVPDHLAGSFEAGGYFFPKIRVFMIVSAAILYFVLWVFQKKTRMGAMVRASVDNPEMAGGLGIRVPLVIMGVFALGALLAGFGGVVGCAFMGIYPGLDFELLPFAFVVVIVGGMGNLTGALLGAVIVALIDNFGKALFPEVAYFTLFAPMAVVLALKPTGLMGKST